MALVFYPHTEDAQKGSLIERIDVMFEASERYKAIALDVKNNMGPKVTIPRDQSFSYNWEEISRLLREVRELPEGSKVDKDKKYKLLSRLAEVYEVLRGAKMPKLEAVRLALINEANLLRSNGSQIA